MNRYVLVSLLILPTSALAAWSGFIDQSVTLATDTFSFGGSNPVAGDSNENYYDGDFGDFDGDGMLDRALISRYGLLLNTGGGVMTPIANTITGGTYQFGDKDAIGNDAVELVDVDGDGDLDSIQGGNGEALKLQINRQGRFNIKWSKSSTAKRIIGVDIERDGDVDLVVSGCFCLSRNCGQPDGFKLWVNDGAGNFGDETNARGLAYGNKLVAGVVAGDIDRDGDFDLVMASGDTTGAGAPAGSSMKMLALFNNGAGVFTEDAFFDIPAAVADLATWGAGIGMDGNGNLDLGDIDGDGDLDAVVSAFGPMGGHASVYYALFVNDGSGGFSEQSAARFDVGTYSGVLFASRIKFVDVDHDNDFDIVAYVQGDGDTYDLQDNNLQLFVNDGAGNFRFDATAFAPIAPVNGGIMSFDVADYTGDGAADLWVGQQGGPVLAYVNTYVDPSGVPSDTPRELRVVSTAGGVELGWKPPPFASTVRAYRLYRSASPGLPVRDRVLIKRVGLTSHGDESFIAPLNPTTAALELGDPSVTLASGGEIRFTDTTAAVGVTYFYSVVHIGYETKASAPSLEVAASVPPVAVADTIPPELAIVSPITQDWSASPRVVLHYGDGGSGINLASLSVSFDKDLGLPGSGGRAAGTNVSDIFFRKDGSSYVAALAGALKLTTGLVTMTASIADLAGNATTKQVTFNVELVAAQPPTAALSASTSSGAAPLEVSFDGSASSDSDGKVVRWEWSFGDGAIALGREVTHTFAYGGTFTVVLLVRDNEGGVATASTNITVSGPPASCTTGATQPCYPADPSTQGIGRCRAGSQVCVDGAWASCSGETTPLPESCNGEDDDCDGDSDEVWPEIGTTCSGGLGACAVSGEWRCRGDGAASECSSAASSPGVELCEGAVDEDCDGTVDDGCPCAGGSRSCYGGPSETQGVGACVPGVQTCVDGIWNVCSGQTLPADEICGDRIDNDCDGITDVADDGGCAPKSDGNQGKVSDSCSSSTLADPMWLLALAVPAIARRRNRGDTKR